MPNTTGVTTEVWATATVRRSWREGGGPGFATCATQAGKLPCCRGRGTPTVHPFSCLATLYIPPPGEFRPWLDTPLQDKAEQSEFSRLPLSQRLD